MEIGQDIMNNFKVLTIGGLHLWLSYNTVVAFSKDGMLYCSENIWTRTTGKHLNYVCSDKSERINNNNFNALLASNLQMLRVA